MSSSTNPKANERQNEGVWQVTDFGVNDEVTWQVKDFDHKDEGTWTITDFDATKEETWFIKDYDHCASENGNEPAHNGNEPTHDDNAEAVLGTVEQPSTGEEAVSVEVKEEFPVHFYDSEIQKIVEVFRSTHKMRWWDSKTGKYTEYFSQAIEDILNSMDRMDAEKGVEASSQEQQWPYHYPEI